MKIVKDFEIMDITEFVSEWSQKKDADGSLAVGIGVHWDKIISDGKVEQFYGDKAWKQIENYYAPIWGNFERTKMGGWLNPKRPDYDKFIKEEKYKIDFYRSNGLTYFEFCAFADKLSGVGVMGDGCHRYVDCNYLILVEGKDFGKDIKNCRLDVLLVDNILEVLTPVDYPPHLT